jgi:pimeloyl-ACP methyl ester carboxylesterase
LVSVANSFIAGVAGHHPELLGDSLPVMSWRHEARDVSAVDLLAIHGPRRGTERPIDVAVYVHGLFIDESNWLVGAPPLPDSVHRGLGWLPLFVRYNSGKHISHNGELLANLLCDLHRDWGTRLGRIQVFGHSMGGLVCRSALRVLEVRDEPVLKRIDRLFLLAVPNQGADLERLGHAIEFGLQAVDTVPVVARQLVRRARPASTKLAKRKRRRKLPAVPVPLGTAVALPTVPIRTIRAIFAFRSEGIRDVRFGYMTRQEWESAEHEPHRFMLNHRRPLPPPPNVRVYCVAASLWPDVGTSPSRIRNDGLVSTASAAGKGGDFDDLGVVEAGRYVEIPLLLHQVVPGSSRVWRQIRRWVEQDA